MNYDEMGDLGDTGYGGGGEQKNPEDEIFHSIYIGGKRRTNEKQVVEEAGKIHIRGVESNLTEVNMIITNIKPVLMKNVKVNNRDNTVCFSYQRGEWPWTSTSKRQCPRTSAERAVIDFCKDCKSNLIVVGILTDEKGNPKIGKEGKAVFGFIRGRGTKYQSVSNYLNDLSRLDLSPILEVKNEADREKAKKFEKAVINHKRFVTNIKVGYASTQYGDAPVYNLSMGVEIPKANVEKIIKISQKMLKEFEEKFNYELKAKSQPVGTKPSGNLTEFDVKNEGTSNVDVSKVESGEASKAASFNFDDLMNM